MPHVAAKAPVLIISTDFMDESKAVGQQGKYGMNEAPSTLLKKTYTHKYSYLTPRKLRDIALAIN